MIVVTERHFDFIINAKGRALLVLAARPGHAKNPFLVFDRRRTMALFRDEGEAVRLTEMPRAVRKAVLDAREIDVAEMDEDSNPARRYRARVILDRDLSGKLKKEAKELY
jgi:hypothetical protein